nr:LysR family transcriptional regulator substrate-binding protein [Paenibacillus sp. ACRRY]
MKLTPNGEKLLKPIVEILNWNGHLKQVVASIHGIETGTVRIGTFTSVSVHWLPGIMKEYQAEYPHVEFQLMEGSYEQIENWIAEGKVDCGFITIPSRENFDVIPLRKEKLMGIVPRMAPFDTLSYFPFSLAEHHPFIMHQGGTDYDVQQMMRKAGIHLNVRLFSKDDYAIIAMVKNGLGVSILPELVMQGYEQQVSYLELEEPSYRFLGLAVRSIKDASPATRRFVQHVEQWVIKNVSVGEEDIVSNNESIAGNTDELEHVLSHADR